MQRDLCPLCSRPMKPSRYGVMLGPLACRIVDTVAEAGDDGLDADELLARAYRGRRGTPQRLRGYINTINRALAGRGIAIRINRNIVRIGERPAA